MSVKSWMAKHLEKIEMELAIRFITYISTTLIVKFSDALHDCPNAVDFAANLRTGVSFFSRFGDFSKKFSAFVMISLNFFF